MEPFDGACLLHSHGPGTLPHCLGELENLESLIISSNGFGQPGGLTGAAMPQPEVTPLYR